MTSPIALSHGPSLVGVFLCCMLYGCTIIQTYYYWTRYRNDPNWTRVMVMFLLIMDTLGTIFSIYWIYDLLVNNFADLPAFNVVTWKLVMDPIFVCIVATTCQLYYARRVKIITEKLWLGLLVAGFSITCGLCTLGTAIGLTIVTRMDEFHRLDPIVYPWLVSSAFVDLLTTVILTISLRRKNSRSGFRRTELLINKLIRVTIANGMLTAVAALLEFILFTASPNTGIHIMFSFLIPKIYVNSVLSSLNQRKASSSESQPSNSWSEPQAPATTIQLRSTRRGDPDPMVITVSTEHHAITDIPKDGKSDWETNPDSV